MRIGLVTMLRNEIDILPAWIDHIAEMFDEVVIMDHGSIDGTYEALRDQSLIHMHLWQIEEPAYIQEAACAFAMRWLFQNTDVGAVVFLDGDEFIRTTGRRAFEAIVWSLCERRVIGSMRWMNCIAEDMTRPLAIGDAVWKSKKHHTAVSKVLVPRSVYDVYPSTRPSLGNHSVLAHEQAMHQETIGFLYHFPLRSVEQYMTKMVGGALSLVARSGAPPEKHHHWLDAVRRIAAGPVTLDDVRGLAANYKEKQAAYYTLPADEIELSGYAKEDFVVPWRPAYKQPKETPAFTPWQFIAAALSKCKPEPRSITSPRDIKLVLKNGVLKVDHGR
jgi:hypothetical protein